MTDPWLPPAGPPLVQPPPRPQPSPPPPAPGAGYPSPVPGLVGAGPVTLVHRQGPSRTAVAALVVGSVALLGVIGMSLTWLLPFAFFSASGFEDVGMEGMGEYELLGTLPQAEDGREYSASEVVAEVEWRLEADWSTHRDLECEPLRFAVDAEATCTGVVDGMTTDVLLRVDDEVGRYTMIQSW